MPRGRTRVAGCDRGRLGRAALLLPSRFERRRIVPTVLDGNEGASSENRRTRLDAEVGAVVPDACARRHGGALRQRGRPRQPAVLHGILPAEPPAGLPGLRSGGRMLLAGLQLQIRQQRIAHGGRETQEPQERHRPPDLAVSGSLCDVYPVRALYGGSVRHGRVDDRQSRQPRRDRRLSGAAAGQQVAG